MTDSVKCRMVKLGELLTFDVVPERIVDTADETFVTVRSKCGGAVERPIKDGKTPVAFTGYRIHAGQLVYSRIDARNNAFAIVPDELDGAVVSKDFPVFRIDESQVLPAYLMHFFRAGQLQRAIQQRSKGITNRQRIKEEELLAFPVPLPSLSEQRRIVGILDRADAIRAKRRQLLADYDELPRSLFTEMFESKGFKQLELGLITEVYSGATPSRRKSSYYGGEIPWVKTGEVQGKRIEATEECVTQEGVDAAHLRLFPKGSVIIAMYGQGKTRGQSAILGIEATTNQACAVIPPSNKFDEVFLQAQFTCSYERLRNGGVGSGQPNLSAARIKKMPVILPPLSLQREFARRVEAIAAARVKVERALALDDELFASLQSRAFRGEL